MLIVKTATQTNEAKQNKIMSLFILQLYASRPFSDA